MKKNVELGAFALQLKKFREFRSLSQKEFAKELCITLATYNAYERKNVQPSIELLIRMAKILDVDVNTLVGWKAPTDKMEEVKTILRKNSIMFIDDPIKKEVLISCSNDKYVIAAHYDLLTKITYKTEETVRKLFEHICVTTFQNDFYNELHSELCTQQASGNRKARRYSKGLAVNSQIRFLGKKLQEPDKQKAPTIPDNLKDGAVFYASDLEKAGDN